ncbi:carbohydrate binding family 9 domain-containing protein [Panacibacter ginsenosidivorans]|uniref:Carbohydrate binding family 9 domain-containing protein n=1 Tax=Panacibacter ginsenosidivorans TaxID=1813871 RepID=A0A5B8V918_9BACT|nr:DUF5916 domain-containing protein [Panacibacter ginsenosidivorans]QEC67413.1 carbohydrate binding family 9 domain-containing protein [Panacibacter ginsenosidivorans]
MLRHITLLLILFSVSVCLNAQVKSLPVIKVEQPPKLDGILDDAVWQNAADANSFIINFPDFGKASTQTTDVKVVYDDEAIYIGAYMHDDPKLIRRQLTQRDKQEFQDADNFGVAFDTYSDKQNAFQFIVTSANVQSDVRISATVQSGADDGNDNGGFDYNWDAVWDSRTTIVSDGWIAEIKIPYSAIRFSKEEVQQWGVNFSRYIRRLNETSYWNPVNPKENGFVNQFGVLSGLKDIKPPLRLSLLPYISTGYRTVPTNEGSINTFLHNGGMDVKYGINESFTMDMTLVPDFGQVQSDNIILNLTPFEQQFAENRPFFTEGTELFNKAGIFYSRRVGATPGGYYDALQLASDSGYTILKNPSATQLYNATKFSGRTKDGLGIGIFNAVTAPMHAEFEKKSGEIFSVETEPLTNYNVFVIDQSLKNRSFITFTNTNVIRNSHARDGNVSALDLSLFDKSNTYNFQAKGAYSYVTGDDPHNGFRTYTSFGKVSGKWQWEASNLIKSKQYDPNDLGILFRNNEMESIAKLSYKQFTPNKTFNFRNYEISIDYINRLQPFSYSSLEINGDFLHVFKNFWDASLVAFVHPFWDNDYYNLRKPGRVLKTVPFAFAGIRGSTDSRKKIFASYFVGYANFSPQKDDPFTLYNLGLRYRFNPKFSLSVEGERQFDKGNIGWALDEPITGEPIAGLREVTQFSTLINATYNFKARMNLSARVRHYWSKVHYNTFYDVDLDGNRTERPFIDDQDENFNAFNIDMFFTWDFRLGSRLIIAYKNALGPDAIVDGYSNTKYGNNFKELFNVPHSNEISIKFVYYIDAQKFIKKKE